MDSTQITKQMIDLQKTAFDNGYAAISTVQEQTGTLISSYVEQFPWVNDQGRKQLKEVLSVTRQAREDFKKAVDEGYTKLEELFTPT